MATSTCRALGPTCMQEQSLLVKKRWIASGPPLISHRAVPVCTCYAGNVSAHWGPNPVVVIPKVLISKIASHLLVDAPTSSFNHAKLSLCIISNLSLAEAMSRPGILLMENTVNPVSASSQVDDGMPAILPASCDLLELQRLLHVSDNHIAFDARYLSSVISKDIKATVIQSYFRAHVVIPSAYYCCNSTACNNCAGPCEAPSAEARMPMADYDRLSHAMDMQFSQLRQQTDMHHFREFSSCHDRTCYNFSEGSLLVQVIIFHALQLSASLQWLICSLFVDWRRHRSCRRRFGCIEQDCFAK